MPCNRLAVQAAQLTLTPELLNGVFHSLPALEVLRDHLAAEVGNQVSVWNDKITWSRGYGARSQANHQVVPLTDVIASSDAPHYVDFCSETVALRVYRDGRVEARDPWRLGYAHPDIAAFQASLVARLGQVAVLVAQQMIAEALGQAAGVSILSDERTPAARILQLEVQ